MKLSVAIATYNEEDNLLRCLASVSQWVDEIVIVDGGSTDRTLHIAKQFNAKVIHTNNPPIFHINKQKALDACKGEWVLQLDADEEVSKDLAFEIQQIINLSQHDLERRAIDSEKNRLFQQHQRLLEKRDISLGGNKGEIVAFLIPRRNYFLGKPMTYAGMYPDGVVRLVKRGKSRFPSQSVHEQIQVDGRIAWLTHDLIHYSNATLQKYWSGAQKYTTLEALALKKNHIKINPLLCIQYLCVKPSITFINLFIRHKGFLDGFHGFLFSFLSSIQWPLSYMKFIIN